MKIEKLLLCFVIFEFVEAFTLVEYFRLLKVLGMEERQSGIRWRNWNNNKIRSSRRYWRPQITKWPKFGEVILGEVKPKAWQLRPLCRGEITDCEADAFCESKLLCKSTLISQQCCAPKYRFCPPPKTLGINCNLQKPTNWCVTDFDCHTTPTRRCCPTPCNYNICV